MRRVVVTGLGLVSPLACGVEESWIRLLAGQSGAGPITRFDASNLPARIACEIPLGDGTDGTYNPDDWVPAKDQRKLDGFITYSITAATQAVEDAGWMPDDEEERCRTGVLIGSGVGGIESISAAAITLKERGPRRISPFFIPGALINLCSGQVSIKYGFKGPNHAVVTACSTGAHAIGDAARLIALGDADVMVAGGAENPVTELSLAGFCGLQGAVDLLQRYPGESVAPLRQGSGRVCDGRRRRRGGAGRVGACQGTRCKDLLRVVGIRPFGRRLPHHIACTGWGWRISIHESCTEQRETRT